MNNVNLVGRLTADPELKYSNSGNAFCNFTLAVNRTKKSDGGQNADFIRCSCSGKTAENLCHYQHKGNQIGVTGRIQTGSYVNNQGQKVYTTDIYVSQVYFLDSRQNGSQRPLEQPNQAYYSQPIQQQQPQQTYQVPQAYQEPQYQYDYKYDNTSYSDSGYMSQESENNYFQVGSDDLPF